MTTVSWIAHNSWTERVAKVAYRGASPPDSAKFYLRLFAGAITRSQGVAQIIDSELLEVGNYFPRSLSFGSGAYDGADRRYEFPLATVSIFPTADLTFRSCVVWADGRAQANKTCTPDEPSGQINCTAHGLSSAEPFCLSSSGTLPNGLSAQTLYYAEIIDPDWFIPHDDPGLGSPVAFTDNGSGTLTLRYCVGGPALIADFGGDAVLQNGSTYNFSVSNNVQNCGFTPGV